MRSLAMLCICASVLVSSAHNPNKPTGAFGADKVPDDDALDVFMKALKSESAAPKLGVYNIADVSTATLIKYRTQVVCI